MFIAILRDVSLHRLATKLLAVTAGGSSPSLARDTAKGEYTVLPHAVSVGEQATADRSWPVLPTAATATNIKVL
jgi:hypothetical protein